MSKNNFKSNDQKISGPTVLLILDGWGIGKKNEANAIEAAKKPNFDELWNNNPHTQLQASNHYVGLPKNQAGNSEAGHMNIGAGRVVEQDSVIISHAINTGQFFKNPAFEATLKHLRKYKSNLHLMGMISSDQSAHADPDHLLALISWARMKRVETVYLHLFTDGRDSPPHSALKIVEALMRQLKNSEVKSGKAIIRKGEWIATVSGRFYAMDRKKSWERTGSAYHAMVCSEGLKANSPQEAITQAYNRNETDEFIPPYVIERGGQPIAKISDNDSVIFFNLRSDRARQMAKPFVQPDFNKKNFGGFKRKKILKNLSFVAMTDFGPDLDSILTAFPSEDLKDTLPMVLRKKRQLYIAEKEKFAHITYFINGGYADPVAGENRVMIDSPNVQSYAETPGMSAKEITDYVVDHLGQYDFVGINFAIPDMVAHTGDFKATVKSVEAVDVQIGRLVKAIKEKDGNLIITADHGNADNVKNLKTGEVVTEHSMAPVPFIIVSPNFKKRLKAGGRLAEVAPTILKLMDVPKSKEMTGDSLF